MDILCLSPFQELFCFVSHYRWKERHFPPVVLTVVMSTVEVRWKTARRCGSKNESYDIIFCFGFVSELPSPCLELCFEAQSYMYSESLLASSSLCYTCSTALSPLHDALSDAMPSYTYTVLIDTVMPTLCFILVHPSIIFHTPSFLLSNSLPRHIPRRLYNVSLQL